MKLDSKSVFDYIFGLTIPGVKLELSRVRTFMKKIGDPATSYPVIHIAGTNGKGSTAAMLAAMLTAYGKRTGLFTSPHLIKPNERIRVGHAKVSDDFIVSQVEAWRQLIEELGITFFEVLTALGMEYFKQQQVEYAVIETGLGGRLDATNVVDPLLCIITSVSMDHENILGHDLTTIAGEKAGIIKAQRPILVAHNPLEVLRVMEQKSKAVKAPYSYVPDTVSVLHVDTNKLGQSVSVSVGGERVDVELPLLGHHQVENFSNAVAGLKGLGFELKSHLIQKGLDDLRWQGRLEVLQKSPPVLYDVAHNPAGLQRLLESLRDWDRSDAIIIAAFNARKNILPMIQMLSGWSGDVLYSVFSGHSSVEQDRLLAHGLPADRITESLEQAYLTAQELKVRSQQTICFIGSHYIAEILYPMFDHK